VRDIDTAVVDSLKVLDPNGPIREATKLRTSLLVRPCHEGKCEGFERAARS